MLFNDAHMRKNTFLLLFAALLCCEQSGWAQSLEIGQSISFSISFPKKIRFIVSYNVNALYYNNINQQNVIAPVGDLKLSLYRYHLGSSLFKTQRNILDGNIAFSYGLMYANGKQPEKGYTPFFSPSFANSINNDYQTSFAVTSVIVLQTIKGKQNNIAIQKVGDVIFSTHNFYINYFNDGGPGLSMLGDKNDRYWTGGLAIGFRDKRTNRLFECSYEKFTGYSKKSFEAAGQLFLDNVIYEKPEFSGLNNGRFCAKYLDFVTGNGIALSLWNIDFDLQDLLHRNVTNNPYHTKPQKPHLDIEMYKRFSL